MDAKPTAERLTSHAALGSINWRTNQSLQRAVQLCLARIGQRRTVHASIHCRRRGEVRRVSSVWCQPIFGDSSHADIRHTPISCQPIFVTRDIRTDDSASTGATGAVAGTRAGTRGGRRPGTARTRPARTAAERNRRAPRRAPRDPASVRDRWNRATVTRPRAAPALLPRAGRCVPYPVARRRASRRKKVKRPRTDPYPTRNPTAPRTTGGTRIRPIRAPHLPARARDAPDPRFGTAIRIRLTSGARGTRAPQHAATGVERTTGLYHCYWLVSQAYR